LERDLLGDGSLRGIRHKLLVTSGEVWTTLAEIIEKQAIDVLVVGTHGRTGLAKVVLGSIAETAVHRALCPVLIVGPHMTRFRNSVPPPKTILFPTDLSLETERVAPYAVLLAQKYAAKLVFLNVTLRADKGEAATRKITSHLQDLARREGDDLICCPASIVVPGAPAETILRVAQESNADLIILGIRPSYKPNSHFGLPVAYKVISNADCPVVTIRALHYW